MCQLSKRAYYKSKTKARSSRVASITVKSDTATAITISKTTSMSHETTSVNESSGGAVDTDIKSVENTANLMLQMTQK